MKIAFVDLGQRFDSQAPSGETFSIAQSRAKEARVASAEVFVQRPHHSHQTGLLAARRAGLSHGWRICRAGAISLSLLAAVAALPANAQTSSANAVSARGFLDAGKDAFKAKDYSRAAGLFQKAFAADPSLTIALYNQAFALKKANLLAQARDVYDAYTKVKPEDPDGFYGLADVYRLLGNEKNAIQTFNIYLTMEKRPNKDRYVKFAREYLAQAGASAAPKKEEPLGFQAREAKKSADEMYVAANKELRAGSYASAAASFATVYDLDPRRHQALLKMGLALRKDKQYPAAASAYQRYIKARPGDFDGLFGLAETKRLMGAQRDAADLFKKYLAREDRASRKKYRAYAQEQLGALNAAIAAAPKSTPKAATSTPAISPEKQALLDAAQRLYSAKEYAQAAEQYDAAWRLDPSDVDPLRKKALSLRKAEQYPQARTVYENLVARDRNDLDSVFGLAETLRLEGNAARSQKVFTTYLAKERRPERKSYVDYARQQLSQGAGASDGKTPVAAANEGGANADPALAQAKMKEGAKAYGEKRYKEAIAAFRAAQVADPNLDDAWMKEALALRKAGAFDEARKAYLQYQTRRPDDLDAVFGIAETDRLAGKSASALTLFRKYVAEEQRPNRSSYVAYAKKTIAGLSSAAGEDPNAAQKLVTKGTELYRQGKFDDAASVFAEAKEALPSDPSIAHRHALSLRKGGRYDEAIAAYDALLTKDETDLDAVFGRAESLRLKGDDESALQAFRTYLLREDRADRAKYQKYATAKVEELSGGAATADAGDRPAGAVASGPPPGPASPSERHAAVLGRNLAAADLVKKASEAKDAENYDAARQYLALAIARAPRDPNAYFVRGELFEAVGNAEAARDNYLKVMELAAGTPLGDRAERQLNGADASAGPRIVRSARQVVPLSAAEEAKVNAAIIEGRAALDRGAAADAVPTLEEAVRTDKRSLEAWMVLGDAYLASDDDSGPAKAVGAFQRAAFLAPNAAAPLWGLARAYDRQEMKSKATPLYARYAKSDASDVDAEKQKKAELYAQGLDPKRPWIRR